MPRQFSQNLLLNEAKKRQRITAVLVVLIVAAVGTYILTSSHAATPFASSIAANGTTANGASKQTCSGAGSGNCVVFTGYGLPSSLIHSFGAYRIASAASADSAAQAGMTTTLIGSASAALSASFTKDHIKYIVGQPANLIVATYQADCGTTPNCVMTAAQNQALYTQLEQEIVATRSDPNVLGYYILDDSPGNIHDTLIGANAIIKQYGVSPSGTVLPSFCVFGANLDYKLATMQQQFTPNHGFFDTQISNYSPQACDNIMIYIYAAGPYPRVSVTESNYDWNMTNLLPYIYSQFQARGWNGDKSGLTAVPDAFSDGTEALFPTPTAHAITTQVSAFCNAGFGSIMAFLWDPLQFSGSQSLGNNPTLLTGLQAAHSTCNRDWGLGP
jgi:hypothetical protein